jgi:4-amino-4-deoxy-L-arabinose transferase-like glycosyltransferase
MPQFRPLAWILVGALVVRVALALAAWSATGTSAGYTNDTQNYLTTAQELLRYGTFTTDRQPEVIRTPGYPLLLIPGLLLGNVAVVTTVLQLAFALAGIIGAYALAVALSGSRRAGLVAAVLLAADSASIALTAYILTETVATTLLVWAVWLLVRYTRSGRLPQLAGAMVLIAACVYVRPAALYLPACVVIFFTVRALVSRQWRGVAHAAVAAILAVVLLVPWSLRNRAHGFGGFSAIGNLVLYYYGAGTILAEQEGVPFTTQLHRMGWLAGPGWLDESRYVAFHPEQRNWTAARRYDFMGAEAVRIIRNNPARYAWLHARGMIHTLTGTGGVELRALLGKPISKLRFLDRVRQGRVEMMDAVNAASGVFLLAVYALVARRLLSQPRDAALLLVVCVAAYLVFIAGATGDARFRVPVMPLLCALAGAGVPPATRADREGGRNPA